MTGINDSSRKINTRKGCCLWAVPDGASNASRTELNNGSANPNSSRQSNNPGPKRHPK